MLLKVYKEPANQKQSARTVTDRLMCQQHCSYFNCNWVDKEPLTRLDVGQMPYSSFLSCENQIPKPALMVPYAGFSRE